MSDKRIINRQVIRDESWWHWTLTVPLLAATLNGSTQTISIAMVLCTVMAGYYLIRTLQVRAYPVQVRIAYLGLLAIGMLSGMQWILWIQLFGTTAMVMFGYCTLLRAMSLLPFNRKEQLTLALIRYAFLKEPCNGGLMQLSSGMMNPSVNSCSLVNRPAPLTCSYQVKSVRSIKNESCP